MLFSSPLFILSFYNLVSFFSLSRVEFSNFSSLVAILISYSNIKLLLFWIILTKREKRTLNAARKQKKMQQKIYSRLIWCVSNYTIKFAMSILFYYSNYLNVG